VREFCWGLKDLTLWVEEEGIQGGRRRKRRRRKRRRMRRVRG